MIDLSLITQVRPTTTMDVHLQHPRKHERDDVIINDMSMNTTTLIRSTIDHRVTIRTNCGSHRSSQFRDSAMSSKSQQVFVP